MASLDELKQKLQSDKWQERRDAVQELGKMAHLRKDVVPLLKQQLESESDDDVMKACVEALIQLDAVDHNVFTALSSHLVSGKRLQRSGALRSFRKLREVRKDWVPSIAKVVKAALEKEDNQDRAGEMIEFLHDIGLTIDQISSVLVRNPNFLWVDVWHVAHEEIPARVIEHTLRRYWWRLPRETRRRFDLPWPWRHCRECHEMWHELIYHLERHGRGHPEAEWRIAALGRWWGSPRWRFGCHDFEELMGLRVEQNVTYEEVNTLRFRFLDAFTTDRGGRPVREWASEHLRQLELDWEDLLRTEERLDRLRDEISELKRQQEEVLREAEGERPEPEPGELPRLPEDLQGRWEEIAERLRGLEGPEGELQRLRRPLEEATERLLPALRERGVRFEVIEVEGVLGEYNFYERKITLYPPMIELAARDLAPSLRRNLQEVWDDLYLLTEMHETAHATAHLGIDSDGKLWEKPEERSSELHELIAQLYTFHLLNRLKEDDLQKLFRELGKRQPEHYRYWECLKDVSLEMSRDFLTGKRAGWFRWDLLSLAKQVAGIVSSAMPLLRTTLSIEQFQAFVGGLKPIVQQVQAASTRSELGEVIAKFLDHCDRQPFVHSILNNALPRGLHSPVYRRLLLANMLVAGRGIKGPTLRLTIEQIKAARTAALMQNELIYQNEIVHGLRAAAELRAFASVEEQAQTLAAQLPKDREEAVRVVKHLLKLLK